MTDFAGIVVGLIVVVFTYWLLEERAKRKREQEAAAARFSAALAAAQAEFERIRAQVVGARLAIEKQARWSVTIYHCGASHQLIFDGTEPSRLAVLHLALRSNQPKARQ